MSTKIALTGGRPLNGTVTISGAKNASLPIIAASILSKESVCISNVPYLDDVSTILQLLAELGSKVCISGNSEVIIDASSLSRLIIDYPLVKAMRASVLVLGPLLARWKEVTIALPGGCAIGPRPINLHLEALTKMGASIRVHEGFVIAKVAKSLVGATINFPMVTVTGTENIMMAATLAKGITTINNAAKEPEVVDLAVFLSKMGARIKGAGTDCIQIEGVNELHGTTHEVLPDRIEAGTFMAAAMATEGEITLQRIRPKLVSSVITKLKEAGGLVKTGDDTININMRGRALKPVSICTQPYPGFPTDMQAQITAMNTLAQGQSRVRETIFDNRFMHIAELRRLGADILVEGDVAIINGINRLTGAPVVATDLRAGASLLIAGLAADGDTVIEDAYHLDRGYEALEEKLGMLGAKIRRL